MLSFLGRKRGLAIALLAAAAVLFSCCVRFLFATRTMTASEPGSYEISVVYGRNAGIPLGSSLSVTELTGERYWEYYRRTRAAVGEIDAMRAFDIRCLAPDGTVIEPAEPVRVRFRLEPDGPAGDSARVVHFGERTEALPVFLLGAASRPEYAVLSVRTSSFSVYTVVQTSENNLLQGEPAWKIENGGWYYLSVGDGGNRQYVSGTANTADDPNGIARQSSRSSPLDATGYCFEKAGGENEYHIWTYVDGVRQYLYMERKDDSNGHLKLGTFDPASRPVLKVEAFNADAGQYGISGSENGRTWYLNRFGGQSGNRFAGWKDGPDSDAGSRVTLTKVDKDPLGIAGKEYLLVTQDSRAVLCEAAAVPSGVQGLKYAEVTKTGEGSYRLAGEGAEAPSLWRFDALEDGAYSVSSEADGSRLYLHIGAVTNNNSGTDVTLSPEPQRLKVGLKDGKVVISGCGGQFNALLNFFGGANDRPNRFSAWSGTIDGAPGNCRFTLGRPTAGTVLYRYEAPENPEDSLANIDEFPHLYHDVWESGYTVREFSFKTHTDDGYWTYTVERWTDGNGASYAPGESIGGRPGETLYLTPEVWKKDFVPAIVYRYTAPENSEDELQHTVGLEEFFTQNGAEGPFRREMWTEGAQIPSLCRFTSYSGNTKWTYTVDHWQDGDVSLAPGDAVPSRAMTLTPVWTAERGERRVRIEYYNELQDKEAPIATANYDFIAPTYTVLALVNPLYYSQSEGTRRQFVRWDLENGSAVQPKDELDLRRFDYFTEGDYETLRLTARWEAARDPWGLERRRLAIINDRFGSGGYQSVERYLAMRESMGKAAVRYVVDDGSCMVLKDVPALWSFEPRDNGTYYLRTDALGQTRYLNITNSGVSLADEPQEIEVLYHDTLRRYMLRVMDGNTSRLLTYESGRSSFGTNPRSYSDAARNDDNGRKSRFLLADLKGSVIYNYPPYAGDYGDAEAPPADAVTDLPTMGVDRWSEGYTVRHPAKSAYSAVTADFVWHYAFERWEVAGSAPAEGRNAGDPVSSEPSPALILNAEWRFTGREPTPVRVKYTVSRFKRVNNNEEFPQAELPAVSGLSTGRYGSGNERYRAAEETVRNEAVAAYAPRGLTEEAYLSRNGLRYRFDGWAVGGTDTPPEQNLLAPGVAVDLRTLDTNGDKTVELNAVWADVYRDPWGLDDMDYMIVYDKSDKDHFALGLTEYFASSNTGLKRYTVAKTAPDVPIYELTDDFVLWHFTALDDGTYRVSSGGRYLYAPGGNGELRLTESVSEATAFRLYCLDGKYVFAYSTNPKKLLDYFDNNHAIFSTWQKDPQNNNKFTLGLPKDKTVVYRYPKYPGPWEGAPADAGTANDLPAPEARLRPEPFAVSEPLQRTYRSRSGTRQWNYSFVGWRARGTGAQHAPGEVLDSATGYLELDAVWKFEGVEDIERAVVYDRAFIGTPAVTPRYSKLTVSGDRETVSGEEAKAYQVASLSPSYYKLEVTTSSYLGNVYEFQGWETEGGERVASAYIDLTDARYDQNGDDAIELRAVWNNLYEDRKGREAEFFVSVVAISADAFEDRVPISTDSKDFTEAVHYSLMGPAAMTSPPMSDHAGIGQKVYALVGYDDRNSVNIAENDRQIRSLANASGLKKDDHTFRLLDFPSDQEVLDYLKRQESKKLTLDGVEVDPADINTDNFTIRWYVCKYQSTSGGYMWHIDGKLTPNMSYLKVQKTFSGDPEALRRIPDNYTISVTSSQLSEGAILSAANRTDIKLTLSDQRSNRNKYGLYSGAANTGSYGYIERDGDTYTWLIPVPRASQYDIVERNYEIRTGGTSYGVAAQYSVSKSQGNRQDISRTPWFGTVNGYAATYPRTSINVNDTSNIQSVNLYNTYVETDTFVIQKIDTGLDGKKDYPMPNVGFRIYNITYGYGSKELVKSSERWDGKRGWYTVDLYSEQGTEEIVYTGSDGSLYLTMKKPDSTGPLQSAENYVYLVEEVVPEGYRSRADNTPPSFEIRVDKQGNFTVDEEKLVHPKDGTITPLVSGRPGGNGSGTSVTGVTITNRPKPVTVSAVKSWKGELREESVTFRLTGTTESGGSVDEETAVLNAGHAAEKAGDEDERWIYTWTDGGKAKEFPMMLGNERVRYAVEETHIGPYSQSSDLFGNWTQTYLTRYRDKSGAELAEGASSYEYASVELEVRNTERGKDVLTKLRKADAAGTDLTNDESFRFSLYVEDNDSTETVPFRGEQKKVDLVGCKKGSDWYELSLIYGETYYLFEDAPPNGYQKKEGALRLAVGADGTIAVSADETAENAWKADGPEKDFDLREEENRREAALTLRNTPTGIAVEFRKINGFGAPVSGAEFRLYDETDVPLEKPGPAVSGDDDGVVRFDTVPFGVYHLKETKAPEGYRKNGNTYLLLVGDEALEKAPEGYRESPERKYAIFLLEDESPLLEPDIEKYGLLNASGSRRVILRKADAAYTPLPGAEFALRRYDMSAVSGTVQSGVSGVLYSGPLDHGYYFLEEKTAPAGHESGAGGWYALIVDESGTWMSKNGYQDADMDTIRKNALEDAEAVKKARTSG